MLTGQSCQRCQAVGIRLPHGPHLLEPAEGLSLHKFGSNIQLPFCLRSLKTKELTSQHVVSPEETAALLLARPTMAAVQAAVQDGGPPALSW